ncbi:MAG: IS200/IS605 family transposase, partial [Gemmatimonadales bacterium]
MPRCEATDSVYVRVMRIVRHASGISSIGYHVVWCPKYRRRLLTGAVAVALEAALREVAAEMGVAVVALEIMPDHVHVFADVPVTIAPTDMVQGLKGASSRRLRRRFPFLGAR